MTRCSWWRVLILVSVLWLAGVLGVHAEYSIPSDRRITWSAGLDLAGGIPTYTNVTCAGLDATGTNDMTDEINTCIDGASNGTAEYIPAGIYKVTGTIQMKSNIALRGAKATASGPFLPTADATATTLNLSGEGRILFNGGDKDFSWSPGAGSGTSITAGYTQGSTSITVSDASGYSVNDIIAVYQDEDSAIIDDKDLGYLGEDFGSGDPHVLQQYTKITAKASNTLTIDPPLYYVTPSPTGQSIRKQTFGVTMAGLEDMRVSGDGTNFKPIFLRFTQFCWVKGIETYNIGGVSSSGSPHIWTQFSDGNEYRDSYHHHGSSNDSGANYGIEFYNWNSRHKIENNIIRETRHSIVFEGGGSGNVILYNYTDDNWESESGSGTVRDDSFLSEDGITSHGAHPYMNLWEGNHSSSIWGDYTQGSSSHNTLFRNRLSCIRTSYPLDSPFLHVCLEVETYNRYYNLIGNVIGQSSFSSGTVVVDDGDSHTQPFIYRFGFTSTGGTYTDSASYSTAIKHGNYDYVSDSVAHWDGGADHTLPSSLYYAEKPAFFGTCTWPAYGPEGTPTIQTLPAKDRFDGTNICASIPFPGNPSGLSLAADTTPPFPGNPSGLTVTGDTTPPFPGPVTGLSITGDTTPPFPGNPSGLALSH